MEAGQVDFINKYVQVQQGKLNSALADVINLETQLQVAKEVIDNLQKQLCLLYTSPSPRDKRQSRMPSSA